ncbi:hypothetical protein Lser_V15G36942 [Lactuca serriola]
MVRFGVAGLKLRRGYARSQSGEPIHHCNIGACHAIKRRFDKSFKFSELSTLYKMKRKCKEKFRLEASVVVGWRKKHQKMAPKGEIMILFPTTYVGSSVLPFPGDWLSGLNCYTNHINRNINM